jgi:hypothetical protein
MRNLLTLCLAPVLLSACAARQGGTERLRVNSFVITEAEMRARHITQAEEAVRQLRPNWLNRQERTTFGTEGQVRIYYDPSIGGLAGLHELPPGHTAAVYYYPPLEAQARFGLNHTHGAIVIALPGGTLP